MKLGLSILQAENIVKPVYEKNVLSIEKSKIFGISIFVSRGMWRALELFLTYVDAGVLGTKDLAPPPPPHTQLYAKL